jgi:hypothetical protein
MTELLRTRKKLSNPYFPNELMKKRFGIIIEYFSIKLQPIKKFLDTLI